MTFDEPKREDLKSTIDAIDADAQLLSAVEEAKRDLEPGDPRLLELSQDAVDLARRLERATLEERDLLDADDEGSA